MTTQSAAPGLSKKVSSAGNRKPPAAGKGRPKGAVNKTTKELKEMILEALNGVGGVGYLMDSATDPKSKTAFLALIGKVLPMTVQGPSEDGAHEVVIRWGGEK